MSSRRSRVSEEEINELISKLQSLLPEARRRGGGRVSGHHTDVLLLSRPNSPPPHLTSVSVFCAAGFSGEATEGDVQLHKKPQPGGGRPERSPLGAHGDHGRQQRRGRDHPESAPVMRRYPTLVKDPHIYISTTYLFLYR